MPASFRATLAEMVDLSLLKDPVMLLLSLASLLTMMGFYVPFVFIQDLASEHDVSKDDSQYIISIIGLTNTIG